MIQTWPDYFRHHFETYMGKPYDVQDYRQEDGTSIRIGTYDWYDLKYRVYGSIGLSAHADSLRRVAEIVLVCAERDKDVPLILANALFFIIDRKIPLTDAFSIGGVEMVNPDFADYFDKSALYFRTPKGFPEGFSDIAGEGETGHVLQAVFISSQEDDFLSRQGAAALEERLVTQGEDLASLERPSSA